MQLNLNIKNMSLASRTAMFSSLIDHCEITGKDGSLLEREAGADAVVKILAKRSGSIYIIGNGGSASIASHSAVDFFNVAKLRAFTLHESSLMTCMANDYGYENAFARMLAQITKQGDVLFAISSSGRSENIRNAVAQVSDNGGTVITLSGFAHDNPLRSMGDINIWLNSDDYGLVEIGHQFILHNLSDRFASNHACEIMP
ncbi:MAG: SIS domain-containing protein [Syntrophobacteraceae bacterium]